MFFFMTLTSFTPPTAPKRQLIPRRPWTDELDSLGRRLLIQEAWPPVDVALRLGVSPNTLTSRASRMRWRDNPAAARHPLLVFRRAVSQGGRLAVAANAQWRADVETGRRLAPPPVSVVAAVGRPWLTREEGECAYVVAGDGSEALACRAPGRARRWGYASYCPGHDLEIYRPKAKPTPAEGAGR